ncbi:MAG: SIS domain-containing protein [archaeon]
MDYQDYIRGAIRDHQSVMESIYFCDTRKIECAADVVARALGRGNKLLVFGNGGSAADAQHFVAELVGWYLIKNREGLPAISLTSNSSVVTAIANDAGYDQLFARQVSAYAQFGDVAFGITTSGSSGNVVLGLKAAKENALETIVLTGGRDGAVSAYADYQIKVPSVDTPRIQEAHITIIHLLCDLVERKLYQK